MNQRCLAFSDFSTNKCDNRNGSCKVNSRICIRINQRYSVNDPSGQSQTISIKFQILVGAISVASAAVMTPLQISSRLMFVCKVIHYFQNKSNIIFFSIFLVSVNIGVLGQEISQTYSSPICFVNHIPYLLDLPSDHISTEQAIT